MTSADSFATRPGWPTSTAFSRASAILAWASSASSLVRKANRKERRSITTDVEAVVEWLTGLHGLKFETPFWKFCHMVSFYADALPPNQWKAM